MASSQDVAFGRVMALAAVTGMRMALGPALMASAYRKPGREALALAAMGEMVIDKLPGAPRRSSLMALVPRALAGFWVAREVAREEHIDSAWVGPAGAAVAVAAALIAPRVRETLGQSLHVPDSLLGLAEDALAVGVGSLAVGLSAGELKLVGENAITELREGRVGPAFAEVRKRYLPNLPIA
ncbi:hypothetical protein BH23PLA1_BH23PLA1_35390 [soil metagenome]